MTATFSTMGLYLGGKRVGEMVGNAVDAIREAPDHGLGTLKSEFTITATMTMTPEQHRNWSKFVESIESPRLSRRAKKHDARIDREFRKLCVGIAGLAHISIAVKRKMVETKSLRALGIRIPRSLR